MTEFRIICKSLVPTFWNFVLQRLHRVVVLRNNSLIIIIVRNSNKKLSKEKIDFLTGSATLKKFSIFDFVFPEGDVT